MRIGSGEDSYDWIDHWAKIPETDSARHGWAHHGVVVTEGGEVVTSHPGDPTIMFFNRDGTLLRSWDSGVTDAHGMTLVKEGPSEYLWIADNGSKRAPSRGYDYPPGSEKASGQVLKMSLDGEIVMRLQPPDLAVYQGIRYSPTSVAVDEKRHGGSGDVWVADGYGASYVHRFDKAGNHLGSINGDEGSAGRFNCPHGIFIDRRRLEPELYVADRGNARIQVYDMAGKFKRTFGSDFLTTPSAFATHGDKMIIAELRARLAILDADDRLIGYLGANESVCSVDGWPNVRNEEGEIVASHLIEPGKFNSPHGLAVDGDGNLYVAEWLIGGRMIKLMRS